MRKIFITLAFLLVASFVNAQQVDTVKADFELTDAKEFLHDNANGGWYILYDAHRSDTTTVRVYCHPDDFFDVLAWKNHLWKDAERPLWEVVFLGKENCYRLVRKDNEKNGDA